ncbi:MAG TPA: hypothetical protein DDZ78_03320, partial [Porphyromonadaceae bacterium]|nr:hypothetical protein [Porphyromonadaceae bacterium]
MPIKSTIKRRKKQNTLQTKVNKKPENAINIPIRLKNKKYAVFFSNIFGDIAKAPYICIVFF